MSCGKDAKVEFSISQGPASVTLKQFATQAEVEILSDSEQIKGVITQAVTGELSAEQCLKMMLRETRLGFSIEPNSHAYAVIDMKSYED